MEKNYMLRLNDNYLYFKKLESVKDFFIKCGVKKNLIDEDEEVYSLNKLEDILGESEFVVRYERGNFQSGWCLLESKRIVVLNKFLNLEARINTLLELIPQLTIEFDKLTRDSQKLYEEVKRIALTEA